MNSEITQLLIIAYAIVPFVNGLVGLVRKSIPSLKSKFIPLISFAIGICLGFFLSYLPNVEYSIAQMFLAGGIAGMAACGVYEITNVKESSK
ncbi:holin [Bacillus sp. 1NLA3E]|uniref:holin n=1 Tax=Bacillus sp. 1NLA3E TaxID=666686 RepID=UPI000247F426|nr:holin [Bacillus sp. 1NLA3E]AGK52047.1 hypothetical protein B1NLA3E_01315 [Bacillus sp. 1NLA3E]